MDKVSSNIERCLTTIQNMRCAKVKAHEIAVGLLSSALARAMGYGSGFVARLEYVARLHDTGKLVLPQALINKPEALNAAEWQIVRQHTNLGFDILKQSDGAATKTAALVALCHHERWDGTGYPDGLAGEAILPEARIVAVCDVYHAMRETRPYRQALNHAQATKIIVEGDPSGRTLPILQAHRGPETGRAFDMEEQQQEEAAGWWFGVRRWPKGAPMTEGRYLAAFLDRSTMIVAATRKLKFNTDDKMFAITPADTEVLVKYGLKAGEIYDMTEGRIID